MKKKIKVDPIRNYNIREIKRVNAEANLIAAIEGEEAWRNSPEFKRLQEIEEAEQKLGISEEGNAPSFPGKKDFSVNAVTGTTARNAFSTDHLIVDTESATGYRKSVSR